jgi:putative addiction module killer protein
MVRIDIRIWRLSLGNFGDVRPIGEGVSYLRIHYDPGYRIDFKKQGDALVILLAGGNKSSQDQDIRYAKELARNLWDASMFKTTTNIWDPASHLSTEEDVVAYLEAALQDGDPQLVAAACSQPSGLDSCWAAALSNPPAFAGGGKPWGWP